MARISYGEYAVKNVAGVRAVRVTLILLGRRSMSCGVAEEGGLNDDGTLYVEGEGPGNYSSIQDALSAAAARDTVCV